MLKCVNDCNKMFSLTLGKDYFIHDGNMNSVLVVNDDGDLMWYNRRHFE